MRKMAVFLLVALAASVPAAAQAPPTTTCVNPIDYGAVPNDGLDDGPAFRSMLGLPWVKHACVGPGVWTLNYNRFASITVSQGQDITGAGPSTTFNMTGSAHSSTWYGFNLLGGSLRNLSMNQIGITDPDGSGQDHMIQIAAGDVSVVSQLVLGPGGGPGFGDCIRVLGQDATHQVTRFLISGVVALSCSRDGIGFQHDVASGSMTGSVFESLGDQDLDYEPSTKGPVRVSFIGNMFLHLPSNRAYSVTLSDSDGGNETEFKGNFVINGAVQMVRGDNIDFEGNVVLGDPDPSSNASVVDVIRNSTGAKFIGNYLYKPASAAAGHVLRMAQNGGGYPSNTIIQANRMVQNTQAYVVYLEGASRTLVQNNVMTMAPWPTGYAVGCTSIGSSCDLLSISGNIMESVGGLTKGAVWLGGWEAGNIPVGSVLVTNNMGRGFTYSVTCGGPMTGAVVRVDDNILGGALSCAVASVGWNH